MVVRLEDWALSLTEPDGRPGHKDPGLGGELRSVGQGRGCLSRSLGALSRTRCVPGATSDGLAIQRVM